MRAIYSLSFFLLINSSLAQGGPENIPSSAVIESRCLNAIDETRIRLAIRVAGMTLDSLETQTPDEHRFKQLETMSKQLDAAEVSCKTAEGEIALSQLGPLNIDIQKQKALVDGNLKAIKKIHQELRPEIKTFNVSYEQILTEYEKIFTDFHQTKNGEHPLLGDVDHLRISIRDTLQKMLANLISCAEIGSCDLERLRKDQEIILLRIVEAKKTLNLPVRQLAEILNQKIDNEKNIKKNYSDFASSNEKKQQLMQSLQQQEFKLQKRIEHALHLAKEYQSKADKYTGRWWSKWLVKYYYAKAKSYRSFAHHLQVDKLTPLEKLIQTTQAEIKILQQRLEDIKREMMAATLEVDKTKNRIVSLNVQKVMGRQQQNRP